MLPGKSLVPATPKDRARMNMLVSLVDSYGYGALLGGIAVYHLFPDFVGGKNDAMRQAGIANARKVIEFAMKTKGESDFIAGELSLADLFLAPIVFYVSLTTDMAGLLVQKSVGVAPGSPWTSCRTLRQGVAPPATVAHALAVILERAEIAANDGECVEEAHRHNGGLA